MKRRTKISIGIYVVILALPAYWLVSELRWATINSPSGKFNSVDGYLACARQPNHVQKIQKNGIQYFIAYAPLDTWFAFPSGPVAYIFGPDGMMVDWSHDTGEDPKFREQWLLPMRSDSTVDEMLQQTHSH